MKLTRMILAGAAVAAMAISFAARSNEAAPDFRANTSAGKTLNLADYRGKYVVLEWWNNGCPFVVKHYKSGNMPNLQKEMTAKGVVWLTICSSAQGKQGFVTTADADQVMKANGGAPTAIILDSDGSIGKLYKAKTSPHMFLINPKGEIVYQGAIDSIASPNPADIPKAENYIRNAYAEASAGKDVSTPKTQPYGCSVKY